jgi:hypothetical protein
MGFEAVTMKLRMTHPLLCYWLKVALFRKDRMRSSLILKVEAKELLTAIDRRRL